jgi:hypothetical protein
MAAQARDCLVCGKPFVARRSDAKTCSPAHRKQLSRNEPVAGLDDRYLRHVWDARRRGLLDFDEALLLLVDPSPAVLDRLEAAAA